jgi:hypothetical protein
MKSTLFLIAALMVPAGHVMASPDIFGGTITRDGAARVMALAGVPGNRIPQMAGSHYVTFRRDELVAFLAVVKHRLSKEYGARWDVRFNCYAITRNFVNEAGKQLARGDSVIAVLPAAFLVAYIKESGNAHAVALVLTDAGPVWLDPQSGPVALTPTELITVFYPQ